MGAMKDLWSDVQDSLESIHEGSTAEIELERLSKRWGLQLAESARDDLEQEELLVNEE